jgi:hypothetical protein
MNVRLYIEHRRRAENPDALALMMFMMTIVSALSAERRAK